MDFRLYSGGKIGLLIGLLEKDPSLSVHIHTLLNEERSCKIAHFPVRTALIAFTMSPLSHDFNSDIHCPVLADVWKKQRI